MQLLHAGPYVGRQTINRRKLAQWADKVRQKRDENWPGIARLILSLETLSAASRLSDRPFLKILSIMKDQLWDEGRIKVVLILRSQAARLASNYAQTSQTNWRAGQSDFERSLQQALNNDRKSRLLDYSKWVEDLHALLGKENVCVLLLEDSKTAAFWQKLSAFCELEEFDSEKMVAAESEQKNIRRKAADRWKLSEMDAHLTARATVDKWYNFLWPGKIMISARDGFKEHSVKMLQAYFERRSEKTTFAKRDPEITLSPEAKRIIEDKCGSANDRLASLLGRDLKSLGY